MIDRPSFFPEMEQVVVPMEKLLIKYLLLKLFPICRKDRIGGNHFLLGSLSSTVIQQGSTEHSALSRAKKQQREWKTLHENTCLMTRIGC